MYCVYMYNFILCSIHFWKFIFRQFKCWQENHAPMKQYISTERLLSNTVISVLFPCQQEGNANRCNFLSASDLLIFSSEFFDMFKYYGIIYLTS